ncbi:ComF family protein [Nocardia thraciensis]
MVAPLIYGIAGRQTGAVLRQYKDNVDARARERYARTVLGVLYAGLALHERCLEVVVGEPVSSRVTVPSSKGRLGVHPFTDIARRINAVSGPPMLSTVRRADDRHPDGERFRVRSPQAVRGRHVLVLDDTWTSGASAQSAAMALWTAGASAVSIMVVGRWLDPDRTGARAFIQSRLTADYDPYRCPVTGGQCP